VCALLFASAPGEALRAQQRAGTQRITWDDLAPLHARLEARNITAGGFPSYVKTLRETHANRVREGDLDHLIFYLLQSTRFTPLPVIEPALSAKTLVGRLGDREREVFLRTAQAPRARVPAAVGSRIAALLRAMGSPGSDARLGYFRTLVTETFPDSTSRQGALIDEYLRVMRFVYEKEFVAQGSPGTGNAVTELYRTRGLSTDTAVEAGYVVYLGLGVLKSLGPDRRIRRVLIVGPGMDLAPRTSLLEVGPPQSYQPWAVIDALMSLGLSRADDLEVVGADINPRVVEHLRRVRREPPTLTLVSGIEQTDTVSLTQDYRDYFDALGAGLGEVRPGSQTSGVPRHLQKTVRVRDAVAESLRAEPLDIVTDRLAEPGFDLVVATNILPYFDDVELMLAMANVAKMLAPGGVFLHNEARPLLGDISAALGLPFEQSRHAVIATVQGAPGPLFDSVFLHVKK
jgi:hypothetical protein